MLKDPYLNEEFEPSLMWFIGVLDVYDREETRGLALEVYNPNDAGDREVLIREYCLNLPYLSYRHKLVLVEALQEKLSDLTYDFQLLFEIDEYEAASWPRGEWDSLENPRFFFQDLYDLALEVWEPDLTKASMEDRSTW
ncbi:hypothetical protein N8H74_28310 [Pseudomonas sp. B2M1-30]|uniref:hypothetical protein n=1 Tax=Pseudomonas TaxID=286 RepID=UPI0021C6CC0E|nr:MULTISPECIES: hypothetical protein [Pseudomonas]MCU0122175.1 hypothetical protein [Pseudomonas sp. B2M1-30]MCU7264221.1 hypothetical protein [Pseudomonas koreensis]